MNMKEDEDLQHHQLTCVVVCTTNSKEEDDVSSSAIFLSSTLVLAPGCLLANLEKDRSTPTAKSFKILLKQDETSPFHELKVKAVTTLRTPRLVDAIDKLFSSSNICFTTPNEDALEVNLLSTFILLQTSVEEASFRSLKSYCVLPKLFAGTQILLLSTPFGSSHLESFYNCWNSGVVSKVIDDEHVLYLSNISCVPGMQGGLVFDKKSMKPAAIALHPVIWKNNEPTGLSIIVSLNIVLEAFAIHYKQNFNSDIDILCIPLHRQPNMPMQKYHNRLARVRTENSWGTGILLSDLYVLTCLHVIKGHEHITVEFEGCSLKPTIAYQSDSDLFDVAVLKLQHSISKVGILSKVLPVLAGKCVEAVGFCVFERGYIPTVTSGIISKVHTYGHFSCHLITTCKVNPGASGGALINTDGQIIAMITANVHDTTNKVIHSDTSFCLSLHILYAAVQRLCCTGNMDGFKDLEMKLSANNVLLAKAKL